MLKIYKRSVVIWGGIVALVLMFLNVHIQGSYIQNFSAFNWNFFVKNSSDLFYLITLVLMACGLLFKMNKRGLQLYLFVALLCAMESFSILLRDFSKVILVLTFVAAAVAHCFYLVLKDELEKACYTPNYTSDEVYPPNLLNLKCTITDLLGKSCVARITNWDEGSLFLSLEQAKNLNGTHVNIEVMSFGRIFKQSGTIVSEYADGSGLGIELEHVNNEQFNWKQFFNICEDMGFNSNITR
jgi:hypothetical protein